MNVQINFTPRSIGFSLCLRCNLGAICVQFVSSKRSKMDTTCAQIVTKKQMVQVDDTVCTDYHPRHFYVCVSNQALPITPTRAHSSSKAY